MFAPSKATADSKLPVYVFIQGGGFNSNSNANYNGASLIDAAKGDMVVVNFNYRVGPYGFLAGREIAANDSLSLNNGLKDQRQALKWVQQHIKMFGGDANHVTLGGASAGGGSVVFQLLAYGGRNDNLFHAAAAESPAFPPMRSARDSQWQYDALSYATGCKDVQCMASMDAVTFQKAVRSVNDPFPGAKNAPIYYWNPTLDYDFVANYSHNEIKAGRFIKVPTIFGATTNEGIVFTPKDITSQPQARQFIIDQFPEAEWDKIEKVWSTPSNPANDTRWRDVASDIYGHIRYVCPSLHIAAAYASNATQHATHHYRWNVGAATHVSELGPIWNNGTSAADVFIHSYWASFVRSFDPNKYKTSFWTKEKKELQSTQWDKFCPVECNRLVFSDGDVVRMEQVDAEEKKRCDVLNDMGVLLRQ